MASGDSKPLAVLLPGFGCDIDSMLELAHVLDSSKSIIHTTCEVFTSETSLNKMSAKVVQRYPDSALLLIGFSMGGWVAQEVANRLGIQVKGLVLISSWTEAPSEYLAIVQDLHDQIRAGKTLDTFKPLVAEGFVRAESRDAMANRWASMVNRIGPEVFLRQTKAILDHPNVNHCISGIKSPVLAIAGAEDALLNPDDQFKCLRGCKSVQTTVLDSCGHNLIWERPKTVGDTIEQWLHSNFEH